MHAWDPAGARVKGNGSDDITPTHRALGDRGTVKLLGVSKRSPSVSTPIRHGW